LIAAAQDTAATNAILAAGGSHATAADGGGAKDGIGTGNCVKF
jgi:hypothetical protein